MFSSSPWAYHLDFPTLCPKTFVQLFNFVETIKKNEAEVFNSLMGLSWNDTLDTLLYVTFWPENDFKIMCVLLSL